MPHYPPDAQADPMFLGIGIAICLVLAALFAKHEIQMKRKKKPELSNSTVDNIETLSFAIACQIRRCKTPEDFNKAVEAIGRYEWEFAENDNAKREAKMLKDILDRKAADMFGVETIF